jgi:hypothetical protein
VSKRAREDAGKLFTSKIRIAVVRMNGNNVGEYLDKSSLFRSVKNRPRPLASPLSEKTNVQIIKNGFGRKLIS